MEQMTIDRVLVRALETVPLLEDPATHDAKVWPLQPKKNALPPFCFYEQQTDELDEDLEGDNELRHTRIQLHVVTAYYGQQATIAQAVRALLKALQGETVYEDPEDLTSASLLVERAHMEQASPDLYETEVGWFRRIYVIDFDYQQDDKETETEQEETEP